MTAAGTVAVSAPAKLNLGLEILGKRADGYHEIRTVMAMIDLADTLVIAASDHFSGIRIDGVPGVADDDNLIARAIRAYPDSRSDSLGYDVAVTKRIPSPGGLGGASSDAAATLRALDALHGNPHAPEETKQIAGGLGADVPFFLGSPVALASGIGTDLRGLSPVQGWAVLVVPSLDIGQKTPTLYRALRLEDFSDGSRAELVAGTLSKGELPAPDTLRNAFERPLYELVPQLRHVGERMREAGALFVALSGAGPAHYSLCNSEAEARSLASSLRTVFGDDTTVVVARLLQARPAVEVREG